jgi:membrane protein DedA with SNARE-associated domain
VNSASGLAAQLLHQYGYVGLGASLVLNCMGIPIAAEVTLPLSGALAKTGGLDVTIVVAIAILGQTLGLGLSYAIARHGGTELLERYGRFVFLNHARLGKLHRMFKAHGLRLVLAGLYLPGTHGYMGYVAGLGEMPFLLFITLGAISAAVWAVVFVGIGALLSNHLDKIGQATTQAGVAMGVVLLVAAAIWYSKHHARHGDPKPNRRTR